MTLKELRDSLRTRIHDKVEPYLWSDEDLDRFINTAVDEACFRARLLATEYNVPIVASTRTYAIPYTVQRIYDIGVLDYNSNNSVVHLIGQDEMTDVIYREQTRTGAPTHMAHGIAANTVDVHPLPDDSGTLTITIRRMPTDMEVMSCDGDEPAIPAEFHRNLLYWAEYEAYSVQDVDSKSDQRAQLAEARFERAFGRRATARGEQAGKRSPVNSNMYGRVMGE